MAKKATIKKQRILWEIQPFFDKHRIKNTYTKIYFLPTLVYSYDHQESFFDPESFYKWKISFNFLVFGFGFWITKEIYE